MEHEDEFKETERDRRIRLLCMSGVPRLDAVRFVDNLPENFKLMPENKQVIYEKINDPELRALLDRDERLYGFSCVKIVVGGYQYIDPKDIEPSDDD